MEIDYLRQLPLLNPANFKKSVAIIGAGATGSYVALALAQMGIKNISVYDFDNVEEHNLPNQCFGIEHIGMSKVDALNDVIKKKCGFNIQVYNEKVVAQTLRAGYIFILTDTMSSRKEIFNNCIKGRAFNTELVIETRMDIDNGRVYAFNPNISAQVKEWEDTLYSDEESTASMCRASFSIVPTVMVLAGLAVWRLLHHYDVNYGENLTEKRGKLPRFSEEVIFQLGPEQFLERNFKTL